MFFGVLNKKQCFVFMFFDLKKTPLCPMTSFEAVFNVFNMLVAQLNNIRGGRFSKLRWFLKSFLQVLSNITMLFTYFTF
jgi:hypothetical protein